MVKNIIFGTIFSLIVSTTAYADSTWEREALKAAARFDVHFKNTGDVDEMLFIHTDRGGYSVYLRDKRKIRGSGDAPFVSTEVVIDENFKTLKEAWDFAMKLKQQYNYK